MKTLAITGLFSPLGRQMARHAADAGVRVLGIDIKPMTTVIPGVEFVRADIRNPLLSQLFRVEQVDTVLHCAFRWRPARTEEVFDSNVLGAMKLLGAAAMAGVAKVIVPSSTVVYGADANSPAFLREDEEFVGRPAYAYVRELREIETFVNGFRRQYPDLKISVLRFANILGGGIASPLAQYLSLPVVPTLLGFDPMMQVIDHADVLRALNHCLAGDYNGVFNIAAPQPLPLSKLLALAAVPRTSIFHPVAYRGVRMGRLITRHAYKLAPLPWDYLRYGWVADTQRMTSELSFEPALDAESTVVPFGDGLREYREKHTAYRVARAGVQNLSDAGAAVQQSVGEVVNRTPFVAKLRRADSPQEGEA